MVEFDAGGSFQIQDCDNGELLFIGKPTDESGNGYVLGNRSAKVAAMRTHFRLIAADGGSFQIQDCDKKELLFIGKPTDESGNGYVLGNRGAEVPAKRTMFFIEEVSVADALPLQLTDAPPQVVQRDQYGFMQIERGRVQWAFDRPGYACNPMGLLLEHVRGSKKLVWASYKPEQDAIVAALQRHEHAWGVFDGNYSKKGHELFHGHENIQPIKLDIWDAHSARKWFVMHHKFAVLDFVAERVTGKEGLLTGSYNWNSERCYDDVVFVRSYKIAEAYWKEYKRIKGKHEGVDHVVRDGFVEVAFNAQCPLLVAAHIARATTSIHVAVWTMLPASPTDPEPVYDALVGAMGRGVQVNVIMDAKKAEHRDYGRMIVHRCAVRTMHHKFVVIDGATVVTGSFNYVAKAASGNCENVIALSSPIMARSYLSQWASIVSDLEFQLEH